MYQKPQQIRPNYGLQNINQKKGKNTGLENLTYGIPGQRAEKGASSTYGSPVLMKPLNQLESLVIAYNAGAINKQDMEFVAKATMTSYLIGLLPKEMQNPMYHGLAKTVVNYLASKRKEKPLRKSMYKL